MSFLKDVVQVLAEGIPVWLRSVLVTLCIIFVGLWSLGINVQSIRDAMYFRDVRKNSILLSNRAEKDGDNTVDVSAEELYRRLKNSGVNVIGISVVSFEPEIQPKVLKVIAKDGNSDFERTIVVGSERYLNGGALNLFIANREGMNYMNNVSEARIIKEIGVESVIAMPIIYNSICVGSMIVFLDDKMGSIQPKEYDYISGCTKIEVHEILDKLYYNF